jgi:hypothetical protein
VTDMPLHIEFTRAEPIVWISRVILCESTKPLKIIRDISLRRGLNIVWGVDIDADGEALVPGHGVGKTSFCRILRYCLGEPGYGTRRSTTDIRNAFPQGYVAAEVHVSGKTWAVARPLGKGGRSCAARELGLPEFLGSMDSSRSYDDFLSEVESITVGHLPRVGPSDDSGTLWLLLLAWCSRDQETRFQHLWSWRSPSSDSGTPVLEKPKEDALIFMRAVFGILTDREMELRDRSEEKKKELKKLRDEQTECHREPAYWINRLEKDLVHSVGLGIDQAKSGPEGGMFDVINLAGTHKHKLEVQLHDTNQKLTEMDGKIADLSAELNRLGQEVKCNEAFLEIADSSSTELKAGVEERQKELDTLSSIELSQCLYARRLFKDCTHIQDRKRTLSFTDAVDTKVDERNAEERDREAEQTRQIVERLKQRIDELTRERVHLIQLKRDLETQRSSLEREIERLSDAVSNLRSWRAVRDGQEPNSRLATLREEERSLNDQRAELRQELNCLLETHKERNDTIRQVFDALVKRVLSDSHTGNVLLEKGGLDFYVASGINIEGEAISTLVVLLSDVCAMITGGFGMGSHPGLLIHDSPREADLSQRVYYNFIRAMAQLAAQEENQSSIPFQYIVTTTTAPPPELQSDASVRLRLSRRREDELLFKKNTGISNEYSESQLDLGLER